MNEIYVHVTGVVATDVRGKLVDDVPLASFRLVSTARRFDRTQRTWVDGDKTWLTVTCWRSLARNVTASVFKAERVVVCGRLKVSEWRDAEGRLRNRTEIIADSIGHDLTFGTSVHTRTRRIENMVDDTKEAAAAELAEGHERETDELDEQTLQELLDGVPRPLSSPDPLVPGEANPGEFAPAEAEDEDEDEGENDYDAVFEDATYLGSVGEPEPARP